MSLFKLGKLDPEPIPSLKYIHEYETGEPLVPPASVTIPACHWQMDGNGPDPEVTNQGPGFQGLGDCTFVGAINVSKVANTLVHESDPIPTPNVVVSSYLKTGHGQDNGFAETFVLNTWHKKGIEGLPKLDRFAPAQHGNLTALKNAIAYYGSVYFGVQLPESAQNQFNVGGVSTWSVVPGSPIEGGHCVVGVGYDGTGIQIVTWSQVVTCTYEWIAKYVDEAYVLIPHAFTEAGHGPALDIAALDADLAAA